MEKPFRPYEGDEPFVFICYAHDDDEVVYPELVRLREQGINVWYDEGISPGAEWTDVLADRIKNCSCFLYYISPGSVASEHCRQELLFAQGESCEILAVHLEQTDLTDGMRLRLGHRQAIMRYEQSSEMYEEKLLEALRQAESGIRTLDETPTRASPGSRRRIGVLAAASALIVAVGALIWYLNFVRPSAIDASPSILVLPFENLSPLEENAFFAAGLHEDILTHLSQIRELTVISRTSSIALAKSGKTIPEMAAQVGVGHVLEGSVRRDADRVRITVQLIEAASDRYFWAQSYDRQLTDIFDVQRDIAEQISGQLELRLDAELLARFDRAPTDNIEAYDLFLRGRAQLTGTLEEISEAAAYFERAVELDPDYADAWAMLGRAQALRAMTTRRWPDIQTVALPNLRRAMSLDPDSPTVLVMMAKTLASPRYRPNVSSAEAEKRRSEVQSLIERALTIAPNNPDVHAAYAGYIGPDDPELGLEHLKEAVRLDPLGQTLAHRAIVQTLERLGRPNEALEYAEEWRKVEPGIPWVDYTLALVYGNRGETLEFLKHMYAAAEMAGPATILLGNTLADVLRRFEEFDAALRWVDWLEHDGPVPLPVLGVRTGTLVLAGRWEAIMELAEARRDPDDPSGTRPPRGVPGLHPFALTAESELIRAGEARHRGDAAEYHRFLEQALDGYRRLDEALPLGAANRGCDMRLIVRYMAAARQTERNALADALLTRANQCMEAYFPKEPPARVGGGSQWWYYHYQHTIWLALNGRIDEALDAFEREYCCALSARLDADGVLEDPGAIFHGLASEPRFQDRLEKRNREVEELRRRIRAEAPWILEPPSHSSLD